MAPAVKAVEAVKADGTLTQQWLDSVVSATVKAIRHDQFQLARIKFGILVGQSWFSEFSSIEENSLKVNVGDREVEFVFEQDEVEVSI